jgi:ABC-2 type transport system permease protein
VVTYVWLGQAFFMMMPFSANPDPEIRAMIRSGSVAYEMARPVDLYWLWLARALAARSAPVSLRAIPLFAVALPCLGMTLPPSPLAALAWIISMVGALFLVSAFATLITISLLWTISGDGIARIVPSAVLLGSGNILPLPLFPDWAQKIMTILPFYTMADAPFRLYMGHLPPEAVFGVLLHQLTWTVLLILAGRALLTSGTRRLVVQGG